MWEQPRLLLEAPQIDIAMSAVGQLLHHQALSFVHASGCSSKPLVQSINARVCVGVHVYVCQPSWSAKGYEFETQTTSTQLRDPKPTQSSYAVSIQLRTYTSLSSHQVQASGHINFEPSFKKREIQPSTIQNSLS